MTRDELMNELEAAKEREEQLLNQLELSGQSYAIAGQEREKFWGKKLDVCKRLNEIELSEANRRAAEAEAELAKANAEHEQARQQWEVKWDHAAEWDLIVDLLDGKPISPPANSVAARVMELNRRAAEAEPELARLRVIVAKIPAKDRTTLAELRRLRELIADAPVDHTQTCAARMGCDCDCGLAEWCRQAALAEKEKP